MLAVEDLIALRSGAWARCLCDESRCAGIIGLGVGEKHIVGYEADSRCRVVALCDIDADKLRTVGERHPGRRLVGDPSDVLSDPSIDVVSIASCYRGTLRAGDGGVGRRETYFR